MGRFYHVHGFLGEFLAPQNPLFGDEFKATILSWPPSHLKQQNIKVLAQFFFSRMKLIQGGPLRLFYMELWCPYKWPYKWSYNFISPINDLITANLVLISPQIISSYK